MPADPGNDETLQERRRCADSRQKSSRYYLDIRIEGKLWSKKRGR